MTEYMYERDTLHTFEGIRIVSHGHREEAGPFVNRVIRALAIIREKDQSRFRRVQRLHYIVNGWAPNKDAIGCYTSTFRACVVDFDKLEQAHKSWKRPESMAMIIVHEATHCLLEDRFGSVHEDDVDFQMLVEGISYR